MFGQLCAVLLDLDGVMYRGARLCNGAREFVEFVRGRGLRPFFLSNNSRAGANVVAAKLTQLGVPVADDEVITAAELLVEYMGGQRPTSVALIGSDWLRQQFSAQGWEVTGAGAEYLVVGLDHELTYDKLRMGVDALLAGARFIGANRDPVNPIEDTLEPGCGCIIAALETATGRRPLCIGKPSLRILRKALVRLNLSAGQTLMVGDSLVSDMLMARRGGTHSALLLSGQTTPDMVARLPSQRQPDVVAEDLGALLRMWQVNIS